MLKKLSQRLKSLINERQNRNLSENDIDEDAPIGVEQQIETEQQGGVVVMPEKEKKKLIRVDARPGSSPYSSEIKSLGFAFVNKTGDKRIQCNDIVFCRDYFLDIVAHHKTKGSFQGSSSNYTKYDRDPKIDFETLRLLLFRDCKDEAEFKEVRERLFSGKRALNYLEELGEFSDRSKITTVIHSAKEKNAWLLTGPKEWLLYPTLISMAVLLLRLASKHGPIDMEKKNPVDSFTRDLWKLNEQGAATKWGRIENDGDVSGYLANARGKFEKTAKNWREIFGDNPDDPGIWIAGYTMQGFVNWCGRKTYSSGELSGNLFYKEAITRFNKIVN